MNKSDLKYLLAYSLPLSGFAAIWFQGAWSFATIYLAFVFIPITEAILPPSSENYSEEEEVERVTDRYFDWLLYLNVPIIYSLIVFLLWTVIHTELLWWEWVGLCLSIGTVMGANGINVAHELGHRVSELERNLAKSLLMPSLYLQFYVEHNRGHHKHVATKGDPATALYQENIYWFWCRAIFGVIKSAWLIEAERLAKKELSFFSLNNDMVRFTLYHLGYLTAVWFMFGGTGLVVALVVALVSILLLETINYIEHYGLLRHKLDNGKFERVQPKHSWNSNHVLGRIVLFELTRHSDHHAVASREFQILRHHDESPQLPLGYPGSMLLSLVPPLWFQVMNRRIPEDVKALATAKNC